MSCRLTSVRNLRFSVSVIAAYGLVSTFVAGVGLVACETLPSGRPNLGVINTPTVSGDPCKSADWFEVGRIDGINGVSLHSSTYAGRCKAQGTTIDAELYGAGWERGLTDYCTPEHAYDAGRSSESYSGVCPKNMEAKFLKRFKVGAEIAALEKTNATIEGQVENKLSLLAAIEVAATVEKPESGKPDSSATVLNDALSRAPSSEPIADKATLQSEIKKLRDSLAQNENQIRELEKSSL